MTLAAARQCRASIKQSWEKQSSINTVWAAQALLSLDQTPHLREWAYMTTGKCQNWQALEHLPQALKENTNFPHLSLNTIFPNCFFCTTAQHQAFFLTLALHTERSDCSALCCPGCPEVKEVMPCGKHFHGVLVGTSWTYTSTPWVFTHIWQCTAK